MNSETAEMETAKVEAKSEMIFGILKPHCMVSLYLYTSDPKLCSPF